jgi:MinD superfamily P-loop ATPase
VWLHHLRLWPIAKSGDCDVDAADLHLLLSPEELESHEFIASRLGNARCGEMHRVRHCSEVCRFGAIAMADGYPVIDPISCEGCTVCSHICPEGAITMVDAISGHWYVSRYPVWAHGPR